MSANCTGILPSPDVSGIGIRASLYTINLLRIISTLFRTVLPFQSEASLNPNSPIRIPSLVVALEINGLALIITAVVQNASKRLSLYHAILIIHMLFFLGMTFLVNPVSKRIPLRFRLGFNLSCAAACSFAIYVATTAHTFGSQPECNDSIKYVFFFATFSATTRWLRIFGIVFCALCLLGMAVFIWRSWVTVRSQGKVSEGEQSERAPSAAPRIRKKLAALCVDFLMVAIGIITLEQTISRNNVLEDNIWSFGQIVPLILLIGPLGDLYDDVIRPLIRGWTRKRMRQVSP